MAYLYQEILKVPGLSGSSRQRQEQLFKKLYPGEKYVASYDQNIRLLGDVSSGRYKTATQPAKTTAKKSSSPAKSLVDSIVEKTKQVKNFEEILKFSDIFSPELTRSSIRQQVEKQFAPEIDQTLGGIRQDFANRNLFRSGLRAKGENTALGDFASRAADLQNQLFESRRAESQQNYGTLQTQFEKNPTTYKLPADLQKAPANYSVESPTPYATQSDAYGGAGVSPNSQYSYLQAYRDYLKKSSPDYYKDYYGEDSDRGTPRTTF